MKMNVSKEWCEQSAKIEGDSEIGAGCPPPPDSEFPWYATNEKQECQIVKPRQVIMGNWLLMRNREGVEWFVPFPELRVNTPNVRADTRHRGSVVALKLSDTLALE